MVAEIEKQFTRLDASIAALKRAQANLKRYRASVLKAACEGKLVPTEAEFAHAEGRDYEPADQLLERILAERCTRWESQEKRGRKYKPTFPILGVFRLKGQPKRDGSIIVRSCKASQSPAYPIRDAVAVVEHPSCPSSSFSCPLPVG